MSDDQPVVATPGPAARLSAPAIVVNPTPARPFNTLPRACLSPDDPGCRVSAPISLPGGVHFDATAQLFALVPSIHALWPPPARAIVSPRPVAQIGPQQDHSRGVWRPPTSR